MYRLCTDYVQIMFRLFTDYVQIMYRLCTDYVQGYPQRLRLFRWLNEMCQLFIQGSPLFIYLVKNHLKST